WMLTQAAQNMARHPGPLGVFFRRLAQRKCWNVAVCATARKLVTIAWLMLKHNEPYRYASPATTQQKLSRLRVAVTGHTVGRSTKDGVLGSRMEHILRHVSCRRSAVSVIRRDCRRFTDSSNSRL